MASILEPGLYSIQVAVIFFLKVQDVNFSGTLATRAHKG